MNAVVRLIVIPNSPEGSMLGNVLARKRGRRKKRNSLTPQIEHYASPCKQEAHPSDDEEEKGALRDAIYNMTNETLVEIYMDEKKGRGIRAGKSFVKNEFVIEYK
ncbi:hypothetical protein COOONC_14055, partial [Cooperia oncophora]